METCVNLLFELSENNKNQKPQKMDRPAKTKLLIISNTAYKEHTLGRELERVLRMLRDINTATSSCVGEREILEDKAKHLTEEIAVLRKERQEDSEMLHSGRCSRTLFKSLSELVLDTGMFTSNKIALFKKYQTEMEKQLHVLYEQMRKGGSVKLNSGEILYPAQDYVRVTAFLDELLLQKARHE